MTNTNRTYSPSPEYRFFLYCPNDGHTFYRTREERGTAAQQLIREYLDCGEWSEQVVDIYAGKITHRVVETERLERVGQPDDDGYNENGEYWEDSDIEYKCDYGLRPLEQPAPAEPADMAVEQLQHIIHREPWATWLRPGGCLESAHCELADLLSSAIAADRAGRPVPPAEGEGGDEPCEICGGLGTIDETLGGYADSNQAAECPGCGGSGCVSIDATPPAEGEVGELVDFLERLGSDYDGPYPPGESIALFRAVDLLKQQAAELAMLRQLAAPVPVSERLPDTSDPSECRIPFGDCWWFDPYQDGAWYMDTYQSRYTHWLPAHVLPLPSEDRPHG